tara:strand:+ start:131 stop:628 length:498 start_codon:yes stop_codon:yes gene_type:complete
MQNKIDWDNFENDPNDDSPIMEDAFANESGIKNGISYDTPENGTFKAYWGNGQLRYQWDYKDGERADGQSKGWWPDGSLKQIKTFKNGKLHGKTIEWFADGNKKVESSWSKGEVHGLVIWYNEDGGIRYQAHYKNGLLWDMDLDKPYTGKLDYHTYEDGKRIEKD